MEPADPVVWANRASCYLRQDEYRQAIADATKAISFGFPREHAYLNRAASHACLGEYDQALSDYDAAAKINRNNAAVLNQRSAVHARAGHVEQAAADWKKAREIDKTLTDDQRAIIPDPPKPIEQKKLSVEEAGVSPKCSRPPRRPGTAISSTTREKRPRKLAGSIRRTARPAPCAMLLTKFGRLADAFGKRMRLFDSIRPMHCRTPCEAWPEPTITTWRARSPT